MNPATITPDVVRNFNCKRLDAEEKIPLPPRGRRETKEGRDVIFHGAILVCEVVFPTMELRRAIRPPYSFNLTELSRKCSWLRFQFDNGVIRAIVSVMG